MMAMMAASAVAVTLVVMVAVAVARAAVMASVAGMATKVTTVIFFGSDGATVEMGAAKAVAVTAVAVSHGGTGSRFAHGHSDGARAAGSAQPLVCIPQCIIAGDPKVPRRVGASSSKRPNKSPTFWYEDTAWGHYIFFFCVLSIGMCLARLPSPFKAEKEFF